MREGRAHCAISKPAIASQRHGYSRAAATWGGPPGPSAPPPRRATSPTKESAIAAGGDRKREGRAHCAITEHAIASHRHGCSRAMKEGPCLILATAHSQPESVHFTPRPVGVATESQGRIRCVAPRRATPKLRRGKSAPEREAPSTALDPTDGRSRGAVVATKLPPRRAAERLLVREPRPPRPSAGTARSRPSGQAAACRPIGEPSAEPAGATSIQCRGWGNTAEGSPSPAVAVEARRRANESAGTKPSARERRGRQERARTTRPIWDEAASHHRRHRTPPRPTRSASGHAARPLLGGAGVICSQATDPTRGSVDGRGVEPPSLPNI